MNIKRLLGTLVLSFGLTLVLLTGLQMVQAKPAATNLFVKPTGVGTICSQASPCALQTALSQAINGDTIYVAEGVYTSTGTAVITLTRSITLYGGWNGAASLQIIRNSALYPSVLDGERSRRVVYIHEDITPTLDGFIITNGNATGLLTNCPSHPDGCGGGIFVSDAHPIITNNTITNNVAAITTTGNPTIAIGYGGGLYLLNATRAIISNNLIISNAASTAYRGTGGGLYLWGSGSDIQVQLNRVLNNSATTTDAYGEGGGISGGPDNVLFRGNIIAGNRTNSAGIGRAAGLFQYGGSAHYLGNLVQGNLGSSAVELWYSQARLEGNRVIDNLTAGGLSLVERSGNGPTLINNIIAHSGSMAFSAYGYDASTVLTATLIHNTVVGSGTGYGVFAQYAALRMTNTIVASTTWGITNTTPASSTVLADHTLFWANTNDGIRGTNPVDGNPAFVNPAGGNYHLGAGSLAIDRGAPAIVTTDIDGERRPDCVFWDTGADEVQGASCRRDYLPIILRN